MSVSRIRDVYSSCFIFMLTVAILDSGNVSPTYKFRYLCLSTLEITMPQVQAFERFYWRPLSNLTPSPGGMSVGIYVNGIAQTCTVTTFIIEHCSTISGFSFFGVSTSAHVVRLNLDRGLEDKLWNIIDGYKVKGVCFRRLVTCM